MSRRHPTSFKEAKATFDETRRALTMTRINLANAESEFALALTAYLALLSSRVSEPLS
jgi:hypothetical protein